MTHSRRIVTHAGSAHADEVVSSALLLAYDDSISSITRVNQASTTELDDPAIYVLDIGRQHDPGLLNFDHHHFDPDAPPRCTLSLVIDHLGLIGAARRCWPWLEAFERWDTGGPVAVENHFKIPGLALTLPLLPAPLEQTIIDIFSAQKRLMPDDIIFQMLRTLGSKLLTELQQLPDLINWYGQHAVTRARIPPGIQAVKWEALSVLPEWIDEIALTKWPDVPRALARKAFQLFLREKAPAARLTITPDERGSGFVLTSASNAEPIDFRVLAGDPEITYIHATGFMAVTRSMDDDVVKKLLARITDDA